MIRAENVTFDYESMDEEGNVESRKRAVNHVNLEIQSGQFIAVLGHNGSGKSTFAKHINALLTPTEGTLWVEGMNTRDESELWNIRQNAGMVFQNPDNQIIGTIVEEDVGFGPENLGVPTDEIWQRVEESLKAVGMYKYRKHSPNKLSGGQKQRVAIAGVMAMHPRCIVLDEPTANLDFGNQLLVLEQARSLAQEGYTVIQTTHHPEQSYMFSDRILTIQKGRVLKEGTPAQVLTEDTIRALYGVDVEVVSLYQDNARICVPKAVMK